MISVSGVNPLLLAYHQHRQIFRHLQWREMLRNFTRGCLLFWFQLFIVNNIDVTFCDGNVQNAA